MESRSWTQFRAVVGQLSAKSTCDDFMQGMRERKVLQAAKVLVADTAPAEATQRSSKAAKVWRPQMVLTAMMIAQFPDFLTEADPHDHLPTPPSGDSQNSSPHTDDDVARDNAVNDNCLASAKTLRDVVMAESPENTSDETKAVQLQKFKHAVETFYESFEEWKEKDKRKMLRILCHTYVQYTRSLRYLDQQGVSDATRETIEADMRRNLSTTERQIVHWTSVEYFEEFKGTLDGRVAAVDRRDTVHKTVQTFNDREASASGNAVSMTPRTRDRHVRVDDDQNDDDADDDSSSSSGSDNGSSSDSDFLTPRNGPLAQVLYVAPNAPSDESKQIADGAQQQQSTDETDQKQSASVPEPPEVLDLNKLVVEEGQKLYWKEFADQLDKQEFTRLFELLEEVSRRLKALTPSRTDRHEQLDRQLDVPHLKQMVAANSLDATEFMRVFEAIWTTIRELHSPQEDSAWDTWKAEQFDRFSDPKARWSDLLPAIMNRFLVKLDRIEDTVNALADRLEKAAAESPAQ